MVCSWCFPGVFLVCSWCFPGVFLVFSWCFPGVFLVCSWCFLVGVRVFSWCFPGVVLVFSWCFPGVFLVFSWCFPGAVLVLSTLGISRVGTRTQTKAKCQKILLSTQFKRVKQSNPMRSLVYEGMKSTMTYSISVTALMTTRRETIIILDSWLPRAASHNQ